MATTISAGTNPYKLGSPPDFGTLYSGRALEFDGVTDYIENTSPSGLPSGDTFTVSAWVKDAGGANFFVIWRRDNATDNPIVRLVGTSRELEIRMLGRETITADTGLTPNVWHHVVVSIDNLVVTFYVDGVQDGSGTFTVSNFIHANEWNTGWYQSAQYSNGELANLQVWDRAWSESDVQYAYTHPEKLITDNSAVTSGTTISNLKLWLPCTEGNPRSPQTTVYDGSPKGLGSDNLGSWTNRVESPWTTWTASGTSVTEADSDGSATMIATNPFTAVAGKTYKASVNLTLNSGNLPDWSIRETASGTVGDGVSFTTTTAGVNNGYWTAPSSKTMYLFFHVSSVSSNFSLSDVSLKEVKMGNHGTTTFYGDELVSNGEFTSNYDGWIAVNASLSVDTNRLKVADDGAYSVAYQGVSTIVGKSYRIVFDASETSGNFHTSYGDTVPDGSTYGTNTLLGDDNTTGTYTYDFVATATTTYIGFGSNSSSYAIYDNISVKEIGVASGWTTADAEPLIPQTALMGMSKPMVFDGSDDYVELDLTNSYLTASFTVSAWVFVNSYPAGVAQIGIWGNFDAQVDGFAFGIDSSGNIYYRMADSDDGGGVITDTLTSGAAISAGVLTHIVMVFDKTNAKMIYYKNGVLEETATPFESTPAVLDTDSSKVWIGRFPFATTSYWNGTINEVSCWDTVLSLAEIQAIFNDGVALDVSSDSGDYESSGDLVGYWRNNVLHTDGTWKDLTESDGSGNNGTINGSPETILLPEGTTSGKDILGFPLTHTNNGWLNLDGSEYVDCGDNDLMSFGNSTGDKPFSLEAWVKLDILGTDFPIAGKGMYNTDGEWCLYVNSSNVITFILFDESVNDTYERGKYTSALSANTWYHIVATYDGRGGTSANDGMSLYLDGSSVAVTKTDGGTYVAMENLTHSVWIGRGDLVDTNYTKGNLDEVKIYNRVLSAAEVTKNWKHGKSKHS